MISRGRDGDYNSSACICRVLYAWHVLAAQIFCCPTTQGRPASARWESFLRVPFLSAARARLVLSWPTSSHTRYYIRPMARPFISRLFGSLDSPALQALHDQLRSPWALATTYCIPKPPLAADSKVSVTFGQILFLSVLMLQASNATHGARSCTRLITLPECL